MNQNKPTATACGIPRSGSTLVAQVMRAALPDWDLRVTHPASEDWAYAGEPLIAAYRDPRDVAASRYRVRLSRAGVACGSWTDLEAEIAVMAEHISAFLLWGGSRVMKIRYEDFWLNHNVIYDAVEHVCGVVIPTIDRDRISAAYGVEANVERAKAQPDFNHYDADGVHGDHIAHPAPGGWRDTLPEWAHEPMLRAVEPYCKALGY